MTFRAIDLGVSVNLLSPMTNKSHLHLFHLRRVIPRLHDLDLASKERKAIFFRPSDADADADGVGGCAGEREEETWSAMDDPWKTV